MQLHIPAWDTCSWCQSPHIWALAQYYGNSSALASKHAVYGFVQECSNSSTLAVNDLVQECNNRSYHSLG